MPKSVLCFGSSTKGDSTPFSFCRCFSRQSGFGKDFRFVKCDSPIDIMAYIDEGETIIMDTVKGIESVTLFSKLDDFLNVQSVSVHDLDLGTFLKVLEGMDKLKNVSIVGIPFGSKKADIINGIGGILAGLRD